MYDEEMLHDVGPGIDKQQPTMIKRPGNTWKKIYPI